ncbi:SAM-dependent methyltransferase [Actinoplanes sp. NPDC051861]|uniref:SAM-dependent methyltransferase n=1 Tax=Actinoplanes sp. NPDC051861 TaxID=3155170 RepID=UPI00341E858A
MSEDDEMPRSAATPVSRNDVFDGRRRRLPSPLRRGQFISRRELADAVNQALHDLFPRHRLDGLLVNERWIGQVERGESRWPAPQRRAALRRVFGVDDDAQLGLYSPRRTGELADDDTDAPVDAVLSRPVTGTGTCSGRRSGPLLANPARRYNYWLGGKDNYADDRASGDLIAEAFPTVRDAARANRAFLGRSVRHLARSGVRQFLDLGCGLPAAENTHEIAQRVAPQSRIVYVDNDPLVMVHARALMCADPPARIGYLEADLRDPETIMRAPQVAAVIDLNQPVGVLLLAVLHYIRDDEQATHIVKRLLDGLPRGSHLVISHATTDFADASQVARYETMVAAGDIDVRARTHDQVGGLLAGLDLIDPGIVAVTHWHPDPAHDERIPAGIGVYGAVGRIP